MKEFSYSSQNAFVPEWTITQEDKDIPSRPENLLEATQIELSEDVWAYIRSCRSKDTGQFKWLEATFKDDIKKVTLVYDWRYLHTAFMGDPMELEEKPYHAVMVVIFTPPGLLPRRTTAELHNSFWYDKDGKITLAKLDQEHQDASLAFKRSRLDVWDILRNDEAMGMVRAQLERKDFSIDCLKIGEIQELVEQEIDELIYTLAPKDDRFTLSFSTYAGRATTYDLPLQVDLEAWKSLLASDRWPEVLKEFPVRISAN